MAGSALQGIHVLDVSQVFAGPSAAMYLADQGAEVIKVEPPEGDNARTLGTSDYLGEMSRSFLYLNRNKRGIVLDLTTQGGRSVLHRLAAGSDVIILNVRPPVAERLAIDYATLKAINPRLIYAAISAYGLHGSDAHRPGYDQVLQARAGILGARRYPDGTPVFPSVVLADMSCGLMLAYAITAALYERQRTGRGRRIDISLLGMAIAVQAQQLVRVAKDDPNAVAWGRVPRMNAPFRCSDGLWLIATVITNGQWRRLCEALGLGDLAESPDFDTSSKRIQRGDEMADVLAAIYATHPRDHWLRLLENADIPCGPVLDPQDTFDDPQLLANQYMMDFVHPVVGPMRMMGSPYSFDGQPYQIPRPAPVLGQHTSEVLQEWRYSQEETAALRRQGAIAGQ